MAPKRTPQKPKKYADGAGESESDVEDAHSEEEKPKKKRKPRAEKSGDAPKRAKKQALTEPETTEEGWTLHPPSLIYRGLKESKPATKIAAFDLDGTLALQKSTLQFPRDADDWILYNKSVPDKLKELRDQGYKLVVFSNQGGIKSALKGAMAQKVTKRIYNVLEAADVADIPAVLATNKDENRKPERGMWDLFVQLGNNNEEPDKKESFFVGDAAGGATDFADSDKKFAENLGIGFKTAKEFFGEPAGKIKAVIGGSSGLNDDMANAFRTMADQQEAAGGNMFGVRATRKAADIIASHASKIIASKDLKGIQGIGKATLSKIDEFLANGELAGVKKDVEAEQKTVADTEMALKFV